MSYKTHWQRSPYELVRISNIVVVLVGWCPSLAIIPASLSTFTFVHPFVSLVVIGIEPVFGTIVLVVVPWVFVLILVPEVFLVASPGNCTKNCTALRKKTQFVGV